jgi:hypothetical protein
VYGYGPSSAQFLHNIWLRHLSLHTTSNMVAPSINMVGPQVMVVPHIVCVLLRRPSPMVGPQKKRLPHLICLRCLTLHPTNMVAPFIDMVAPLVMSINMVAPLVMVAPPIVCVSWHCLWLRLQKIWLRHLIYGCAA